MEKSKFPLEIHVFCRCSKLRVKLESPTPHSVDLETQCNVNERQYGECIDFGTPLIIKHPMTSAEYLNNHSVSHL